KVLGDIGLERRVAALVLDDLRIAHPYRRSVRGGVEAKDDPPAVPSPRHANRALVPHVAHVVARLSRRHHVVEARRHGHLRIPREPARPPALGLADTVAVEREAPQAVEGDAFPRGGFAWTEHGASALFRGIPR